MAAQHYYVISRLYYFDNVCILPLLNELESITQSKNTQILTQTHPFMNIYKY